MDESATRLSRRRLLLGAGALGLVATVAMAAKNRLIPTRSSSLVKEVLGRRQRPASLATGEMEHWMAEVGAEFDIGFTRMRLVGVEPLPLVGTRPKGLRRRPFIVVFDLPLGESYPGNLIYRIHNARYPPFDVFFAEPSMQRLNRMTAVFN